MGVQGHEGKTPAIGKTNSQNASEWIGAEKCRITSRVSSVLWPAALPETRVLTGRKSDSLREVSQPVWCDWG